MPLTDLFRALPGLVLVALLPGYLLATACAPRWRWWLRLALAPGLSGGVAGVAGMLYRDVHLRFDALTSLPVLVLLAAVAWLRAMHRAPRGPQGLAGRPLMPRAAAVIVTVSLVAGVATVWAMAAALRDQPVPFSTDSPVHGEVAAAIVRTGDVLPVIRQPVDHSTWARTRTGFEAVAALTAEVGGPPAALAMLPVVAVSLLLLPMGIAALAWEATGSVTVAVLTPLLGLTLPFPTFPVPFGEFPLVMDSTLVTGMVLAGLYAIQSGRVGDCTAIAVALVASVWVIHGTEVLTALIVGGPVAIAALVALPRAELTGRLRGLAPVIAGSLAGAALVIVATRAPALLRPQDNPLGGQAVANSTLFAGTIGGRRWIDLVDLFRFYVFPVQWLIVLWMVGVAAAVLARRLRWALVAQALMIGCLVDVVVTGRLSRLWVAVYPWSTDDRLMSMQYWVLPMIMAFGAVAVVESLSHAAALRRTPRIAACVALAVVTVFAARPGIGRMGDLYAGGKAAHAAATASDIAVIHGLAAVLPRGSVVLTEGADDAGQWIGPLTDDITFFTTDYARSHPDDARITALSQACTDPEGAASALAGVDAVFVGADRSPEARHPWSAECLNAVPGLRPVLQRGASAAFVVIRR